jgi:predicted alpha/beta hydrolase family esterase
MRPVNIAIVPGNGAGNVVNANWYGWLQRSLHNPPSVTCQLKNMPEPLRALESKWIPFMRDTLLCREDTIIVGHSSGAAAAMRFAETYKVAGTSPCKVAPVYITCDT